MLGEYEDDVVVNSPQSKKPNKSVQHVAQNSESL